MSVPGFPIVGVGASAGGMEAFIELLGHLPADSGMAFVLIQHLDPKHPSSLGEALARATHFPVDQIVDGMQIEPDHVYVIPSNADVAIAGGHLALVPRPAAGKRPHLPIDAFFKSLADDRGRQAIGVVLSGTGSDGAEGLRAIRAADGITLAQDARTARFAGMPEAALRTGVVDVVLPIPELAAELLRLGKHPFVRADDRAAVPVGSELSQILSLVNKSVGVDFGEYKPSSIGRRLGRRMALRQVGSLAAYLQLLREDPAEARDLFEDILIHVTSFFRDPAAFAAVEKQVFPEILAQKRAGGTIRIWSVGCSTGEEPYSLVIALLEFLARENAPDVPLLLFGTDISAKAIEKARAGYFSDGAVRDLSPERLARHFTKVDGGGYRINKAVRDRCAFVTHDIGVDPPFSKIDLVFCRNVLIYFGPALQKRALSTFQFALNQPGFLVLGHAEGLAESSGLFSVVDKDQKIFARTSARSSYRVTAARDVVPPPSAGPAKTPPVDMVRRAENLLLEQYVPPGVIVNERMEILHFRGRTGPYLEPAPGQPQHDLLKMAREGLVAELRMAISQARKEKTTVRRSSIRVEQHGPPLLCDVVVVPVATRPEAREDIFAVLFEETGAAAIAPVRESTDGTADGRLADELKATKEYLQSIIEDHQQTNEELLSANEELIASNEELQSLNEELETAKEEMQSVNEELTTLNEELKNRNNELNSANSDLVNILGSVEVPIVIVDAERRIRRFTPKARPLLNLLPTDVGRPIDDIRPTLAITDLDHKITEVIETVRMHEEETQDRDGRWHRLQIRPYTTVDKRIDGAVLSIVDIDALKRALGAAEWARDYARATVEAVGVPLVMLDENFGLVSTNEAFQEKFLVARSKVEGRPLFEVMDGAWDDPQLRAALGGVLADQQPFQRLELECELPGLGARWIALTGRSVALPSGARMILLALEDITERLRAEAERTQLLDDTNAAKASAESANRSKDLFLATLSHELRTPLSSLLLQAQLLQRGKMDDARLQRAGQAIERATRAQAALVNDLLDISRIVAGKMTMDLEMVSLGDVVRAAIDTVQAGAEHKHIALEVKIEDGLPTTAADPLRLQQVVLNLLTNAIKFTPEHGRVQVTVDTSDGQARIRVTDNGLGIDAEFLPQIFQRFSQEGRGQPLSHGGLGLGLAIVHYLVTAHGGTVTAESAGKGLGSTFTVLLPLRPLATVAPAEAAPPAPTRPATIKDVKVLVVEDDPPTREALTLMLGLSGADVRAVASADGAMTTFREFRPELLICDIAMPVEDGYSLLRRIRALGAEGGGDIPALALTALATKEDQRRAFAAGFQLHLAKPVDLDHLVSALATLL